MFKISDWFKLILCTVLSSGVATAGNFGQMNFAYWKIPPVPTYYANSFDGTSSGYLTVPSFTMSYAADFTIECWFKTSTNTIYASIYSDETATTGGTILLNNSTANGQITVYIGNLVTNFTSTSTGLNNNAWHYVTVSRTGTTMYLFIDGNLQNTTTTSGTGSGSTFRIGNSYFPSRYFNGLISNFRVNYSGLYTSSFSVPTAPLTAITNTQLLTCESSTFIDLSSNAYSITNNGGVTISATTTYP